MSTTSSTIPEYALAMPDEFGMNKVAFDLYAQLHRASDAWEACHHAAEGEPLTAEDRQLVLEVVDLAHTRRAYTVYTWFLSEAQALLPRLRAWAWGAKDPGVFKRVRRTAKKLGDRGEPEYFRGFLESARTHPGPALLDEVLTFAKEEYAREAIREAIRLAAFPATVTDAA